MKMKRIFILILILGLLMNFNYPIKGSLSSIELNETFDSLNGWEVYGYIREGHGHSGSDKFITSIPPGLSTKNGVLTSSFNYIDAGSGSGNTGNGNMSNAWHTSEISYGKWLFDVFIDDWAQKTQVFETNFLQHNDQNNFNYTGKKVYDLSKEYSGVALEFQGRPNDGLHNINFYYATGSKSYSLDSSYYNSFHKISIDRNITGEFSIFLDNQLIITSIDNTTYNPQKFGLTIYSGTIKIDNITISDMNSDIKNSSGFEWIVFTPIFIALSIINIFKRKSHP